MAEPAYPDVVDLLLVWLKETFVDLADEPGEVDSHVGSDSWPITEIRDRLPFVEVSLNGGAGEQLILFPQVEVNVFGPSRAAAYALADAIRARLSAPGNKNGLVVDRTFTRTVPSRAPWDNQDVVRIRAVYELSLRAR